MLLNLPGYISGIFVLVTLITLLFIAYALKMSSLGPRTVNRAVAILGAWLCFQGILSLRGFYYTDTRSVPPHFALLILPPLLLILFLFMTKSGRTLIDSLPLVPLTLLSIVRVFVELTLYWLFLQKYVPKLMTFSGRNFDILSGITAPFITYLLYKGKLNKNLLLAWNIICLGLLLNIVVNAVLSAPLAFQQFAFDQPNVALLYFPFVWLPSFVVPVVMFTHLVAIHRILKGNI